MKWGRWAVLAVLTVLASGALVRWSLKAQVRAPGSARTLRVAQAEPARRADDPAAAVLSVQDALHRPFDFPFDEPTTLTDVQKYLSKALGTAVVLDLAALDRLEVDPEDTVQLALRAVRLKTGLKLLLDQLDLTYRVVPEDNLLIITDAREAGEPIDRALRELKALHQEMHDLQDAVDDLRDLVEEELGIEPEGDSAAARFVRSGTRSTGRRSQSPPRPHSPRGLRRG